MQLLLGVVKIYYSDWISVQSWQHEGLYVFH
jgi:hypothetical protein